MKSLRDLTTGYWRMMDSGEEAIVLIEQHAHGMYVLFPGHENTISVHDFEPKDFLGPVAGSPKVKPLVWRAMYAETPWGTYKVTKIGSTPINGPGSPPSDEEVSYRPSFNGTALNYIYGTSEAAQEACQQDHERRVMKCVGMAE